MNQFILVNDPTDNKQKEIPVNEDGTVSLITLEHYFPTAYGLEYKNPDTGAERVVKLDESGKNFLAPAGPEGWANKVFEIIFRSKDTLLSKEEEEKTKIRNFFKYVCYFNKVDGFRYAATVLTKQLAVTANHCIPSDKKQNDIIQIFGHEGQPYRVSIILQNIENDFALLRLFANEFPVEPLAIEPPSVGTSYFTLGYPIEYGTNINQQFVESPSAVKGVIMTTTIQENNCVFGDSGGAPGFSGGPVISLIYPRTLLGIVLGGRKRPLTFHTDSFLPNVLDYCTEAPRVKILPAHFVSAFIPTVRKQPKPKTGNAEMRRQKPYAGNVDEMRGVKRCHSLQLP